MRNLSIICSLLLLPLLLTACNDTIFNVARGTGDKLEQAWEWRGARLGDKVSQYRLGKMYCCGGGGDVVHDTATALKWWCRAARQNQKDAMYEIGKLYAGQQELEGSPVVIDYTTAYTYLTLAQKYNHPDAHIFMEKIAPKLSLEDHANVLINIERFPHIACELGR